MRIARVLLDTGLDVIGFDISAEACRCFAHAGGRVGTAGQLLLANVMLS